MCNQQKDHALSDKVVVQPDVFVVCDRKKLSDGKTCKGAPDFVIEVVSDGSVKKDFVVKRAQYEKAGVREYWVIDQEEVYTYQLCDGRYQETVYKLDETLNVEVNAVPGCTVVFNDIYSFTLTRRVWLGEPNVKSRSGSEKSRNKGSLSG